MFLLSFGQAFVSAVLVYHICLGQKSVDINLSHSCQLHYKRIFFYNVFSNVILWWFSFVFCSIQSIMCRFRDSGSPAKLEPMPVFIPNLQIYLKA